MVVETDAGLAELSARLSPPALKKAKPALTIDLSSIAKGHAVDRVSAALSREGVAHHMVEVGGEVRVSGEGIRLSEPTALFDLSARGISPRRILPDEDGSRFLVGELTATDLPPSSLVLIENWMERR